MKHSSFPLSLCLLSLRFFPSCCLSFLCSLRVSQPNLHLFFLLVYTSTSSLFPLASFSPRPGIITRLSNGLWTCQSFGRSCKRRTQLTTPLQRRWCQTCASCSGIVLSSIMYVLPVSPLPYFLVTRRLSWLDGMLGVVPGCLGGSGSRPLGPVVVVSV